MVNSVSETKSSRGMRTVEDWGIWQVITERTLKGFQERMEQKSIQVVICNLNTCKVRKLG